MTLPQLPPDKAQHLAWGTLAVLVGVVLAHLLKQPAWVGALGLSGAAGVVKEVYDYSKRTGPLRWQDALLDALLDALATVAPSTPLLAAAFLP